MSLLSVGDLTLAIGRTPILHEVSLTVERGEILGLVGESGSGKSLTALSILKLLPEGGKLSGRIAFAGADLGALDEKAMCQVRGAGIGMIFQEPLTALNPLKTIGDQVAETVLVHGAAGREEARRIARRTLDRVGMGAERFPLSLYPHELSGGQRQRVGIAMAIAMGPGLLVADEPTTALDVTTQARILELLRRLVEEDGMGLVLITHDLGVVAQYANRIAVMKEGRIVETGESRQVLTAPRHPYTAALMADSLHVPPRSARPLGEALLEVEGLSRDYPLPGRAVRRAVNDVSFTIRRGENVGLVGESGCGKSTLARAILGVEPVSGGRVLLAGAAVTRPGGPEFSTRRRMQMVFQDPYGSFDPRHKVARLVAEPFHLLGKDAPKGAARRLAVERALEEVGLTPADADKYIHEFSGGQRQRLAIARALVIDPDLIVLDEAVSALDVTVRARILDLLAGLSERLGISYLFISHDLHVVRAVTDRVLVMKEGRIVEEGETEKVFTDPVHPYTRDLIAAAPRLGAALAGKGSPS